MGEQGRGRWWWEGRDMFEGTGGSSKISSKMMMRRSGRPARGWEEDPGRGRRLSWIQSGSRLAHLGAIPQATDGQLGSHKGWRALPEKMGSGWDRDWDGIGMGSGWDWDGIGMGSGWDRDGIG